MLDIKGYLSDQLALAAKRIGQPLNISGTIDDLVLAFRSSGEIDWLFEAEQLAALLYLTAKPYEHGLSFVPETVEAAQLLQASGALGLELALPNPAAGVDMRADPDSQAWEIGTKELAALLELFLTAQYYLEFDTAPVAGTIALNSEIRHFLEFESSSPLPTVLSMASGQAVMEFASKCAAKQRQTALPAAHLGMEFGSYANAVLTRYRKLSEFADINLADFADHTLESLALIIVE